MPHLDYVGELPADVMALQEVRLTQDGIIIADDALRVGRWLSIWGQAQPCRPNAVKHPNSPLDAKQGGVSLQIKNAHNAVPSPRTKLGDELYLTGRWQSAVVRICGGDILMHVITVYGYPRANEGGETYEQNEEFMRKVFLEAESLGNVPVAICGDFNVNIERSQILSQNTVSGKWIDAVGAVAASMDLVPEPTYQVGNTQSRIDHVFLNPVAGTMLVEAEVLEVPEHGIKRHHPVRVV